MSCFHPITAWKYPPGRIGRGGKAITFNDPQDDNFTRIQIPCGKCVGCSMSKSRDWALRCMHEASLYEDNCFATFTYEVNPVTLCPSDFQLFMKRLRKSVGKLRFFQCGEYGDHTGRPHHHALFFGYRPKDMAVYGKSVAGYTYTSESLDRIWTHGRVIVGDVTFASAAYVARYIFKKQKDFAGGRSSSLDHGENSSLVPPYITMSRRPGLGSDWISRFHSDVFPKGYVTFDSGIRAPPSRFYREFYKRISRDSYELYKDKCLRYFLDHPESQDPQTLFNREYLTKERLKMLIRAYDVD